MLGSSRRTADGCGESRWWSGKRAAALAAVFTAVLVPAGGSFGSGAGGDWPQVDHDASANRANTTEATITPSNVGQLSWRRGVVAPPVATPGPGCDEGWSAPLLVGKRLYSVATGRLMAIDVPTGATVWQRDIDITGGSVSKVFAVSGGRVLVGQIDCRSQSDPGGSVRAYSAGTGQPLWAQGHPAILSVSVYGNWVVTSGEGAAGSGSLVQVFDATTGALVWSHSQWPGGCRTSTVVAYERVFYSECDPDTNGTLGLAAARIADGVVTWRRPGDWTVHRADTPGTASRNLYVSGPGGTMSLDPASGATRYQLPGAGAVLAVGATRVYATCGGILCAYNRGTGALLWTSTATTAYSGGSTAAVAGLLLYLNGSVVVDVATGAEVAQVSGGWGRQFSVGNGYLAAVGGAARIIDIFGLPGS